MSFSALDIISQESLEYQKPPKEILELVDFERAPRVSMDDENETMVLLYSDSYKSISDLSEEEIRLGGLRINPKLNIGSRVSYYNNVKINVVNGEFNPLQVKGLPNNAKLTNISWSPDQKKIAMTHTTDEGVELWVLDIDSKMAKRLTGPSLNANLGSPLDWFEDSKSLLVKMIPDSRKPLINNETAVPTGPTISVNDGKKAQNRTYQDLLKNKNDEHNFEQLVTAELYKVDLNGNQSKWLGSDTYRGISFSPDGNYVLISRIKKPYSYIVQYNRFPYITEVYSKNGQIVETVLEVPLIEDLPKGFMAERTGKRDFSWRSDRASTLIYAVALDGGDPANNVEYRDEVFELAPPFKGDGKPLLKTINRFSGIAWGNDNLAIAYDYWWNTRNTKAYTFDPSDNTKKPNIIFDRNYQDRYSDPGSMVYKKNEFGSYVLDILDGNVFMIGAGYTEEGQFPFINKFNLATKETERLYTSEYQDRVENISEYDPETGKMLVRIESPKDYPNYYFRDVKNDKLDQLTFFKNPFESMNDVDKQILNYKRDDGLDLSGILYLPKGYDKSSGEKVPLIVWAYPREFKDKSSAGQNTNNPNEFVYPYYGSMIYWVTQGYAVLDEASFPIVGEGEEEPNDTYRTQLVANAKAAIDAVDELGYIDTERVAVGGHSYGAFMVANLLTHSDLFAAGIARSGAYNRTLTPFGFQSEERSYWDAPEIYYEMSPFMHAEKMDEPLLLIHGEADNNSGTYPMQSERYFNALKGLGATVRLVMLPKESHGYRSRESILHILWEQDQWLDKHVKNKK
ncbi:MAG: prolyl oligopeptidase family serine peptidase [Candidatus Kapaibacteriales bacterium]